LGDGTSGGVRASPVAVVGLSRAVAIAPGNHHACALLVDDSAGCWGDNFFGQLGIGATSNGSSSPVSVVGLSGVTAIAAGAHHACAAS
jgi:alpha-tubulin suppressor-like RCC1 family protein